MKNFILIGKNADNHLIIVNNKISRKHAKISKIEDGQFLIEDFSTNGTFVNDKRIKKTLLKKEDKLRFADYEINTNFILELLSNDFFLKNKNVNYESLKKHIEFTEKFFALKEVYKKYQNDKKKIVSGSAWKKTGFRALLALIPFVGNALGIMASGTNEKQQDALMALSDQFKIDYVCPNCKMFLGDLPWQGIKNQGKCRACKTKWELK